MPLKVVSSLLYSTATVAGANGFCGHDSELRATEKKNSVLTVDVRNYDRLRSGLNDKNEKYGRQAEQCTMGKPGPILEPESLVTRL